MIKLLIEYSKEFELERIESTINRLDWYLSNKYSLSSLSFPKNIDVDNLKEIKKEELVEAVGEEYDESKFVTTAESIVQMYEKYEVKLEDFIKSIGLSVIPEVKVSLTNYGIGGSYHLPNEIIVNINRFFSIGLIRNILHEIIHLHIQALIDQYKISQWNKETIVNLLFEKAFPEIYKEPNIPMDTTKIRKIFEENFPNIKKVISLISE
ncbi:MAG TPA: hypothetical protein PLK71_00150 [Candidatus Paceibacterota bacterium]|nr:hypothetical protein [Candidatus Woesebacteria bacterium]HOY10932.1 hypothetical protein [Candidatus Paceibacterota bacterium]HPB60334.1 hypothetical protein [Candidatus Paceibacterota bacterium]HPY12961.1 hypothetical protein [Candidatus Paceibacterota bacterium]HQB27107.1 hypothetical protein [Candidatus Paceibacterota bacterium]